MSFRFHHLLALAFCLFSVASEAAAAGSCRELFRTSASTLPRTTEQTFELLQQIRSASPMDVAPLLAELGREISSQKFADADLRFITSAIFKKTKNAQFPQVPRYFSEFYVRRDLILARYQRILLSEISDGEQRRRVIDLFESWTPRNQY